MINPRMGMQATHTQTAVPRRFTSMTVEVKAQNNEIEVPADAIMLGVDMASDKLVFFVGVPDGSGAVKRKLWVVPQGQIITVEAGNGEFLGNVVMRGAAPAEQNVEAPLFYAAVFIETQKQAIERATYRAGFRAPPSTHSQG